MNTVGLLSQLGIMNPFNRKQESEADYLGMIFHHYLDMILEKQLKFGKE